MPAQSAAVQAYWQHYLRQLPAAHPHQGVMPDAFAFGGGGQLADELAALVLEGRKRATASLPIEFAALGEPLPQPGSVSIILDSDSEPVAIIERTAVVTVPFGDVGAAFAATEGEGDGSLAWWRAAHRRYFGDVCRRLGGRFDDGALVLCQEFSLVWPLRDHSLLVQAGGGRKGMNRPLHRGAALLVIDVQQGLMVGRGAMVDAGPVIDRINRAMRSARNAAVPVILIQHESQDAQLARGSTGWQLDERLDAQPADIRLCKRATDSFHNTALQHTLQQLGVDRLVICGFQSEFCVDTTTRRALALGYPVTLVADGHSTADNDVLPAAQISAHHNATLTNIVSFGPRATALPAGDPTLFDAR